MIDVVTNFLKNNLFSVITAIIAIIAIFQTKKQTELSNKHFLFDKRLNDYLLAKGLVDLYNDNKKLLDYSKAKKDEAIVVDLQFCFLTNISFLEDISCIIKQPKNNEFKTKFLIKLEELRKLSNEIRFVFSNKSGLFLSDFVYSYQILLMEIYKYQLLSNDMLNNNKRQSTYKELQNEFNESDHRKNLFQAIEDLKKSYDKMIKYNSIVKIEKLIKI